MFPSHRQPDPARLRPAVTSRLGGSWLAVVGALGAIGLLAAPVSAQYQRATADDFKPDTPAALTEAREKAGVDEKIGDTLPLEATFTDSSGQTVRLGDVFNEGKPVIIQMAYYRCPQLCGEVMNGMATAMQTLGTEYEIGRDFEVLTISFDSRESAELAALNKDATVDVMSRSLEPEQVRDGWGFWVGNDLSINQLTNALGFRFAWIEAAQEYSHPGVIVLCTPEGKVSRYLHGTRFDPQSLRLSLVEASEGQLRPSLADSVIYYCFAYDPTTGKYTATAMTVMKIGGVITVLTLAVVIGFLIVAERNGRLRRHAMAGTPEEEATTDEMADKPAGEAYTGAFGDRQ